MATNYKKNMNKRSMKSSSRKTGRSDSRVKSVDKDDIMESRRNDASWYGDTPQLVKDAASLAYAIPVGSKFNVNGNTTSVPGLMRLSVHPTIGISKDNYSPINVAARNIYSYVRHANSGHSNYDSPDLMMYLVAMDNVYSLYSYLVRLYGVLTLYTQKNRYYPRAIVEGMYCDPDDFMENMADFRYYINQFVKKMGSFCVPASMSYFRRHMWMYEGLYVDDNSAKAQTYFFVPDGFYKFDEVSGAGKLVYTKFAGVLPFTVSTLIDYCNSIITPIFASEDMNIMSGDILKAYGDGGIFKVTGISEDYIVLPKHDKEVLSQIQNASVLAPLQDDDITQDVTTGAILFNPHITNLNDNAIDGMLDRDVLKAYSFDKVLNMYTDDVEPSDTMVATRLSVITGVPEYNDTTFTSRVSFDYAGSEIIVGLGYCKFGVDGNDWVPSWYDTTGALRATFRSAAGSTNGTFRMQSQIRLDKIVALSKFDYHPELKLMDSESGTSSVVTTYYDTFMDLNNFTIITATDLYKMHETALLSEFSCPQMGAFSNKYSN